MYTNARYTKNPQTYADLLGNIEWTFAREIHHNVSLLGISFVQAPDGADSELWIVFLDYKTRENILILESEITRKFHETITLVQVGRSGATLLPLEYTSGRNNGEWQPFDPECAGLANLKGIAQMRRAQKIIRVLDFINARTRELCLQLRGEWIEWVREQEQIDFIAA